MNKKLGVWLHWCFCLPMLRTTSQLWEQFMWHHFLWNIFVEGWTEVLQVLCCVRPEGARLSAMNIRTLTDTKALFQNVYSKTWIHWLGSCHKEVLDKCNKSSYTGLSPNMVFHVLLLNTEETSLKLWILTHSNKLILQSVNTKLHSGKVKTICFG
jgi:hypothetical protein